MSLIDKINSQQMEEIKEKCVIKHRGNKFYINNISPLPRDYMFSFNHENGSPYFSYCVQLSSNIEVLPNCDFACKLKEFLIIYLNKKQK